MKQPDDASGGNGAGGNGGGGVDGGGGGYDDGNMEPRVKALEDGMSDLKADVAVIKSNYATKTDISELKAEFNAGMANLHKSQMDQVKWIVGTIIVMGGLGIAAMTFVVNNMGPKPALQAASAPQAAAPSPIPPIIINIPPLSPASATAASPGKP